MLTPNNEDRNLPDGLVARPLAHRKASICSKLLQLQRRTLSVAASRFLEMIAADFNFVASSDRKATAD